MNDSAITNGWQQIEGLRPRLRSHTHATAHVYRGRRWYVLADRASNRHMRFNEHAYEFIGRLDGEKTVAEIYQESQTSLGDNAPSQQNIINLLTQLYSASVLHSSMPPDVEELFKRYQSERRSNRFRRWLNPLSLRFPLFDPDNFLNRYATLIRPLFSTAGIAVWGVTIALALLTLFVSFGEISAAVGDQIIKPQNLLIMLLLFPLMKALHEFGHAFAVKVWGGEVHEMGITLLVLMPIPYVDASAAWAFQEKYKRVLVGAAGLIVELFIAAVALIIWAVVEPGLLRDTALAAFFIGGVSSIFFNANPLLRFDGYYILQDLVEIPNLYSRSSRYWLYQIKVRVLGLKDSASPVTAEGEHQWFLGYGALAWMYRMVIMVVISIFLASKYFAAGVVLALWSFILLIVLPLYRGIRYLVSNPELSGIRKPAIRNVAAVSVLVLALISLLPFSLHSNAQGIVWVPEQAHLFAKSDGFVTRVHAETGDEIEAGTLLVDLRNPNLQARANVLQARYRELKARYTSERFDQPVKADQTQEEMLAVQADLESIDDDINGLQIYANVSGRFVVDEQRKLMGSFIKKGEAIGYIVSPDQLIVRLVVPQQTIGLVQRKMRDVSVRLVEQPHHTLQAELLRQTPSGSVALPSRALGATGGGDVAVDASDRSGTTAAEPVFQIDLKLLDSFNVAGLGSRALVRFNHGRESLAQRWLRGIRQLLLSRLSI